MTNKRRSGLSKEAWAAVTAITVALIGGLVTIMTTRMGKSPPDQPPSSPPGVRVETGPEVAHKWVGKAKAPGQSYTINVEIRQHCGLDENCGTISVLEKPCYGEIYLKAVQNHDYEFDVRNFDGRSSTVCTPGPGEHFSPRSDGRLDYRADWGVQGILNRADDGN